MVHKSYDTSTMETNYDLFDIDFVRYTRLPNVVFNIIGTGLAMSLLLFIRPLWGAFTGIPLGWLTFMIIIGGFSFFLFLSRIAGKAGAEGAVRLAGRRGLFSYCVMTLTIVLILAASGDIGLETLFGSTLRMVFASQIFCALLAVPFDYCSTLFFFKR